MKIHAIFKLAATWASEVQIHEVLIWDERSNFSWHLRRSLMDSDFFIILSKKLTGTSKKSRLKPRMNCKLRVLKSIMNFLREKVDMYWWADTNNTKNFPESLLSQGSRTATETFGAFLSSALWRSDELFDSLRTAEISQEGLVAATPCQQRISKQSQIPHKAQYGTLLSHFLTRLACAFNGRA